jgi:hypothetical protein
MLKCYRCGKQIKEKVIPLKQTSTDKWDDDWGRLLRKPTRPEDKGFSEAMRKTEADVLKWVLGEKDKLPFE